MRSSAYHSDMLVRSTLQPICCTGWSTLKRKMLH